MHGEWFKISEEDAVRRIERWRKWIVEKRPYKKNGTLRASWLWKCEQATRVDELDWSVWYEFTRREKFARAMQLLVSWVTLFLPALVGILLIPGSFFGLGLIYPFYSYGASLQSWLMCFGLLVLYVLYWFRRC